MEKSNVIRCFNEGKHYIETCLEQIVSLEQNDDKEMRIALKGVFMVKVSYKAAENFCKVVSYVIDGKDGAQQMKAELICLKEKLVQLYNGADRQNLSTIKHISEVIMDEIKEVEKWTGDNTSGDNSGTGNDEELNKEDIVEKIKNYKTFYPNSHTWEIKCEAYYKTLTDNEIIDKKWTQDLFEYCVERAFIKDLIVESQKKKSGNRGYARLFMNDVASLFYKPEEYRKKAAELFGLNCRIGAVGGLKREGYREMMKDYPEFKSNWQRKS